MENDDKPFPEGKMNRLLRSAVAVSGLLLLANVPALAYRANKSAFHGWMHPKSCYHLFESCKSRHAEIACKYLLDAAITTGGQWGLPEARAVAKIKGESQPCHPEDRPL
jgi:hypothetical protein